MLQIFGSLKNYETQKALRWFKERKIAHQFIDLRERGLSPGELRDISRFCSLNELIDVASPEYKKRGLAYMEYDPVNLILEVPLLLREPLVRTKTGVTVGFKPAIWQEWFNTT